MKERIIEIVEFGQPQSLIQRENAPITELIQTDLLIQELNEQLHIRSHLILKNELVRHLENYIKQPIALIGNVDYQKGYRQSISDCIHMIKLLWGN